MRFLLSTLLALMVVPGVRATRMIPLTIEELAGAAVAVVHGRVREISAARDASGRIHRRIELEIAEVWKGRLPSGICSIVAGGGVVGELEVKALGQPEYHVGEEVVLFLARNDDGGLVTLGLAQGKFEVHETTSGGKRVSNLFWGASVLNEDGGALKKLSQHQAPLTLEELRRRTQEVAR